MLPQPSHSFRVHSAKNPYPDFPTRSAPASSSAKHQQKPKTPRWQTPAQSMKTFCLIWCGLNGFMLIFLVQTKKRDGLRTKYGITEPHLGNWLRMDKGGIKNKHGVEESLVEDCLASFLCPCCGLIQQEKEVVRMQEAQSEELRYQKPQGMRYP
ncbi:hypothetical protein BDW62DRAFT_201815 [Aspergillus aurantiobrunneus]